jgi:hypothetical protein
VSLSALDATWEPGGAELILLAADPPAGSGPAFHDALQGLLEILRCVLEGARIPGGLVLETSRAASEAFPLDSVESWALFRLIAHAERQAAGRGAA